MQEASLYRDPSLHERMETILIDGLQPVMTHGLMIT